MKLITITPKSVKKLSEIANGDQVGYILKHIERSACFGESSCIIGDHVGLKDNTIKVLKTQGWDVRIEDKVNYTVHW